MEAGHLSSGKPDGRSSRQNLYRQVFPRVIKDKNGAARQESADITWRTHTGTDMDE